MHAFGERFRCAGLSIIRARGEAYGEAGDGLGGCYPPPSLPRPIQIPLLAAARCTLANGSDAGARSNSFGMKPCLVAVRWRHDCGALLLIMFLAKQLQVCDVVDAVSDQWDDMV